MTRSYIPLNSLRAFEAAARHLSFTQAAIELNVTHSAISHQPTVEGAGAASELPAFCAGVPRPDVDDGGRKSAAGAKRIF